MFVIPNVTTAFFSHDGLYFSVFFSPETLFLSISDTPACFRLGLLSIPTSAWPVHDILLTTIALNFLYAATNKSTNSSFSTSLFYSATYKISFISRLCHLLRKDNFYQYVPSNTYLLSNNDYNVNNDSNSSNNKRWVNGAKCSSEETYVMIKDDIYIYLMSILTMWT